MIHRHFLRGCVAAALALALLPTIAAGQSTKPRREAPKPLPAVSQESRYRDCMAQAQRAPLQAFNEARSWETAGGGVPARHCVATALFRLERFDEAALELESISSEARITPAMRAEVLGQAARAWIVYGQPESALVALGDALLLAPRNPDLLIDRAQALADLGESWKALDDLNAALDLAPRRADALLLRGSAHRRVGSLDLAIEDATRALAIEQTAEAYLERGTAYRLQKKTTLARADLIRAATMAPEGPVTVAARDQIERMELGIPDPPAAVPPKPAAAPKR